RTYPIPLAGQQPYSGPTSRTASRSILPSPQEASSTRVSTKPHREKPTTASRHLKTLSQRSIRMFFKGSLPSAQRLLRISVRGLLVLVEKGLTVRSPIRPFQAKLLHPPPLPLRRQRGR